MYHVSMYVSCLKRLLFLRCFKKKKFAYFTEMKKHMKSIAFVQNIARQRKEKLVGHSKNAENDSTEFYLVKHPLKFFCFNINA